MGGQTSKASFQKTNSVNNTVNFINSSGEISFGAEQVESTSKATDVYTKFSWVSGGDVVLLTGSFNRWKHSIPLKRQGDEFSITIELPRGLHYYKFIVDDQWRFSPEDPYIPDGNGNINNYIDTTNFEPLISQPKPNNTDKAKEETDRDTKEINEFKACPKVPLHYQHCNYMLKDESENTGEPMSSQGGFEQSLQGRQLMQLFNSAHRLSPPSHVQVDHLIHEEKKEYESYCVTQRFRWKYTTYRHFFKSQG